MSLFTDAIIRLKAQIDDLGERRFVYNHDDYDWLKKNDEYPIYAEKALQATWNTVHIIFEAKQLSRIPAYAHLYSNRVAFTAWFKYLEPKEELPEDRQIEAGTLRIIDEKTYQLGLVQQKFFKVAIKEKDAQALLTDYGISNLKRILKVLTARLASYAAARAHETYKLHIDTSTAQLPLPVPDVIIDDGNTLSYHLAVIESEDPSECETNRQAYVALIETLHTYGMRLAAQENDIERQHALLKDSPLPAEALNHPADFLATKDNACTALLAYKAGIHQQHVRVNALLTQAKQAYQGITNKLAKYSEDAQKIVLTELTIRVEETSTRATTSSDTYQQKKQTVALMRATDQARLEEIKARAPARRDFVTAVIATLETAVMALIKLEQDLSQKSNIVPVSDWLDKLGYSAPQKRLQITELCQKTQKISKRNVVERALSSTDKEKEKDKKTINDLIAIIKDARAKAYLELERSIDITQRAVSEPPESYDLNSLYALQKQYNAVIQSSLQQQESLRLDEVQSRQDALEHRQALLNRSLSELNFRLLNIQQHQQTLELLRNDIARMTPQAALECLKDQSDLLTQLKGWFEFKSESQPQSSHELYTNLSPSFIAQGSQLQALQELYATITTQIPSSLTDKKHLLEQESLALEQRNLVTQTTYQELQRLTDTLTTTTKKCWLQKLAVTIRECNEITNKIASKQTWPRSNIERFNTRIELQLIALEENARFFTPMLPLNPEDDLAEELLTISTCKAKLEQAKLNLQLANLTPELEPVTPAMQLFQLKTKFFNSDDQTVGGLFGEYLQERAETFWFLDWCSHIAAVIFCCFSYQSELSARTDYLSDLQDVVLAYQQDSESYAEVESSIAHGLERFTPRSLYDPEYQKSLHAKLSAFQAELHVIHEQMPVNDTALTLVA